MPLDRHLIYQVIYQLPSSCPHPPITPPRLPRQGDGFDWGLNQEYLLT